MIRISNIKISLDKFKNREENGEWELIQKEIEKKYRISEKDFSEFKIIKRSLDARKKDAIQYIYTVDMNLKEPKGFLFKNNMVTAPRETYPLPIPGVEKSAHPPIIVGMGPAGIFCGLELARMGYAPLILEQGEGVENRVKTVEEFWKGNVLNETSNVTFGEGGAGTFSDGKLNTMVKDSFGRHKRVLNTFAEFGAPGEITYVNKPHIGTDLLRNVVKNIRNEIIRLGGEVRFGAKVTDIQIENQRVQKVTVNHLEEIPCEILVLAIGHSSRDTFTMIHKKGMKMEPKAFAIGVRIEHPQKLLNVSQYGEQYKELPAADYKVTHQSSTGRGVYSFCMCPGGFVVNASSEKNRLAINGMSNYLRNEENGNSALIVTVTPEDFFEKGPLGGVAFQRHYEELAYNMGKGRIPIQRYGDFKEKKITTSFGEIQANTKGGTMFGNLWECLPEYVAESIFEGIEAFEEKIKGFSNPDALLSAVETRTSSPLRINRNEKLVSNISGIYPCGEGAGYAGGITSAAIDGIKVFEEIVKQYTP